MWAEIVAKFSRCFLTDPKDMLVALIGIAKAHALLTGDAYVVGMWQSNLEGELLWYIHHLAGSDLRQDSRRALEYRAPSFSWASIDGIIECNLHRRELFCSNSWILDIKLHAVTDDSFGLMKDGYVLLSYQLQRLRTIPTDDTGKMYRNDGLIMVLNTDISNACGNLWMFLNENGKYFDPTTAD